MSVLTQEQQDVIKKVQKLLALAGNNPNEHEAEAATQKAMDLLAAYNLSMHVATSTANTSSKRDDKKRKGGLYAWQRSLWQAVAELNFCMYWPVKGLAKGSTYEHRTLGSEVNVLSTELMAEYLQQAIERIAQAWAKDMGYKSVFVKEAIAFREGMATTICQRLRDERQRADAADAASRGNGTGTELVLADVAEMEHDLNLDHFYGYEPGTHARRRAERKAQQAEAMRRYEEQMAERRKWEEENPEEAARQKAEQRKQNEEWWAEHQKKNAKAEARRAQNAGKPGYDDFGYKIRYRNMTPQEQRAQMSSFHEGRREGEKVSLNKQAEHGSAKTPKLS